MEYKQLGDSIERAYQRIKPHVFKTPLMHSPQLSQKYACQVHLKLESEQKTGSFKIRGAFNKLLTYLEETGDGGNRQTFVTASTGNHGMGAALAFTTLKQKGVVFVPETVDPAKEKTLRLYDVTLKKYGTDCVETEMKARSYSDDNTMVFISPYADYDVIKGQGTIAKEVLADLPQLDAIFVTVGGGGLISGIAAFLKNIKPEVDVIGCLPLNSPVMYESVKAGKIVDMECKDTLSDASAGGIEAGSPTFNLCRRLVDRWVTVTEEEIGRAMYELLEVHHKVVEGSAGVAMASMAKTCSDYRGKNVAVVICGANLSMTNLKKVIKNNEKSK